MNDRATAKTELLRVAPLESAQGWLSLHELAQRINEPVVRYNENALATRANDLERDGLFLGRYRAGKNYKEYARALSTPAEALERRQANRRQRDRRGAGGPAFKVAGIQPQAIQDGHETVLIEVPVGTLLPGQEVRFA